MSFWKSVKKTSKKVGKSIIKSWPLILASSAVIATVTPTPYDDAILEAAKQITEIVMPSKSDKPAQ